MLNDFAGNKEIKETLQNIVSSGRFPHAFIIEGEKGSGRKTLAKIIAAAAICDGKNPPCGLCRACTLVKKNAHSDIITVAPEGATFKIASIREIRKDAFVMPVEAKKKVYILLECEKMNEQAQNAFLKVLEEPPQFTVFILVASSASALLTTVRSRCVTLSVRNPEFCESLNYILKNTEKDENSIKNALEQSHGNIGTALNILEGKSAKAFEYAKDFFNCIINSDRFASLKIMKNLEKDRQLFAEFLCELRLILQNEAKSAALGKSHISISCLGKILKTVQDTEATFNKHIGQPLSVPVASTMLCAEIFTEI